LSIKIVDSHTVKPDAHVITQVFKALLEPDQVVELRALGVSTPSFRRAHTVSGYFDNVDRLTEAVVRLAPVARGVYFTPNPLNPALLSRALNRIRPITDREPLTSDADVRSRRWLLIDCDPIRPSGISSTEMEHEAALTRVHEIREALAGEGWSAPILADSGNGAHMLYWIDLPNDHVSTELIKRCLEALAFRFDDARVSIDQKVYNAARIWKVYGTMARKGDDTPDRPHRLSRVLEVPQA
jgi:hypothetical protein